MQLLGQGCGGLLCALQIGRVDLLDVRVRERFCEAFRSSVSRLAQQGIRFIGHLVRMAHQKNGAHALRVRTSERYRHKEEDSSNSCECSHKESASYTAIPPMMSSASPKSGTDDRT